MYSSQLSPRIGASQTGWIPLSQRGGTGTGLAPHPLVAD